MATNIMYRTPFHLEDDPELSDLMECIERKSKMAPVVAYTTREVAAYGECPNARYDREYHALQDQLHDLWMNRICDFEDQFGCQAVGAVLSFKPGAAYKGVPCHRTFSVCIYDEGRHGLANRISTAVYDDAATVWLVNEAAIYEHMQQWLCASDDLLVKCPYIGMALYEEIACAQSSTFDPNDDDAVYEATAGVYWAYRRAVSRLFRMYRERGLEWTAC